MLLLKAPFLFLGWLIKVVLGILAICFMTPIVLALGALLYAAAYGFVIFFGGWIMMYFFL